MFLDLSMKAIIKYYVDDITVDGFYSEWGEWESCTESCGGGTRDRKRTCTPPQHEGKECSEFGPVMDMEVCNAEACAGNYYYHYGVKLK